MKNILGVAAAAVAAIAIFALPAEAKKKSQNNAGEARIEFAEKVYDFGTIKESAGAVSHDFEFTNKGDGNLVILKATAECGCTRPKYPDSPVAPGKSGKLKVTYNPAGRPGHFDKVVTVTTNGNPRKVRIKIRGNVVE